MGAQRALVVGIDFYEAAPQLHGCVNDARTVAGLLSRNEDGTRNFDCEVMLGTGPNMPVGRRALKQQIKELFATDVDVALLYFAGHGYVEEAGGYLYTSDAQQGDGVSIAEIVTYANSSKARNRIVILDSCHSGVAGEMPNRDTSELSQGLTILTASTSEQYASEANGQGLFTGLLADALRGGAASLTGAITPASVYAHIDQSLGATRQRPVFKTNVKQFVSLRKVRAPIAWEHLLRLPELFPSPDHELPLDPSYESSPLGRTEDMPPPDPRHTRDFAVLQKYNRLNLLVPVGAEHMWHAAMEHKACRLTALGKHYHSLVSAGRLSAMIPPKRPSTEPTAP